MATRKKVGVRRRVGAHHRKLVGAPTKARPPQKDTLTLDEFKEFFKEPISRYEDGKEFPCQQEYLERRRRYVEDGDLLALFCCLQCCQMPVRFGSSFEDAALNRELDPEVPTSEVPRWLLDAALKLMWRGLDGKWPKGKARHARPTTALVDRWRDLVRTAHFLKARKNEMAWDEALEHVSKTLDGAGTTRAIEAAYTRVAAAFKNDPTPYLFSPKPVPEDWDDPA